MTHWVVSSPSARGLRDSLTDANATSDESPICCCAPNRCRECLVEFHPPLFPCFGNRATPVLWLTIVLVSLERGTHHAQSRVEPKLYDLVTFCRNGYIYLSDRNIFAVGETSHLPHAETNHVIRSELSRPASPFALSSVLPPAPSQHYLLGSSCPMSASLVIPPSSSSRKRTLSFSSPPSPRPAKLPNLQMGGSLKRTHSSLSLFGQAMATSSKDSHTDTPRTIRRKPKGTNGSPRPSQQTASPSRSSRNATPIVLSTASAATRRLVPPTQIILPSAENPHAIAIYTTQRTTSPLNPKQTVLPARPTFPKSKREPNLYKVALIRRMKMSEQMRNALRFSQRSVINVWQATEELEKMVEENDKRERALNAMIGGNKSTHRAISTLTLPGSQAPPPALTSSWVVVPNDDWEMVDPSA